MDKQDLDCLGKGILLGLLADAALLDMYVSDLKGMDKPSKRDISVAHITSKIVSIIDNEMK